VIVTTNEALAKERDIFFVLPEVFYPASSLLLSHRETGFRLNTLPE
jgi:hypothetical protein